MPECDVAKTQEVLDLFECPQDARDEAWRKRFYDAVVTASFRCTDPQVDAGPDGFEYFGLETPEPGVPFTSYCISSILAFVTENGLGVAINPRKPEGPDWVFTAGDLVSLRLHEAFERPVIRAPDGLDADEPILFGQPGEAMLPSYSRRAIHRFLADRAGIERPGVFGMHRPADARLGAPMQLVFSVFHEDFPAAEAFEEVAGRIGWFLPRHYPLGFAPRAPQFLANFAPLWEEPGESPGASPGQSPEVSPDRLGKRPDPDPGVPGGPGGPGRPGGWPATGQASLSGRPRPRKPWYRF